MRHLIRALLAVASALSFAALLHLALAPLTEAERAVLGPVPTQAEVVALRVLALAAPERLVVEVPAEVAEVAPVVPARDIRAGGALFVRPD